MKLTVKTLKGSHFEIRVQPTDTIMAVKKNIEDVQGKDNYPCGQQLLIHNGKVLKDETTLADNKVSEDGFLVVMLSKSKSSGVAGTSSAQVSLLLILMLPWALSFKFVSPLLHLFQNWKLPVFSLNYLLRERRQGKSFSSFGYSKLPKITCLLNSLELTDTYGQAASNLVAGSNLEQTIQQIMDMGGGTWDKETVTRALRAAYNNPERAVDYLYSGIPEAAEIAVPVAHFPTSQAGETGATPTAPVSSAPNSSPLNMFPQEALSSATAGGLGSLEFLRNNQQFQALRTMVQANPQILQPMLQELGKHNPQLLRLIQEHDGEFLQLINEPPEGSEGDIFDQPEQEMPHAINVTPSEQEAIERLEAMGFERALVIEAFLACDRNEELAANYLLENAGDFED
ncbi:ubiquitin domain-containing protein/UBA domain-containing protein/XPC-binding domain-containing protein [Cephalotus follicularis]|uniref:Ubiquitin receptor RAD23 n=1 Tax=Cephalotus follicularis TaxID=3775 RepID=A0A1Q3CDC3_CEPFO|nr:ubiquitin domain-containing protein/UBA domain-containing protein/XPC-binding domain-containing protein [Cephalotus follicularis]